MTRDPNEEQRGGVGGEAGVEKGERERERETETMNPAPTVRNNSSPIFEAWVSESTSGSRRVKTPWRLWREETGTRRHCERHGHQACPLFPSCSFASYFNLLLFFFSFFIPLSHRLPSNLAPIMNSRQCVVLRVEGAHFHTDGFFFCWRAGKLDTSVQICYLFFLDLCVCGGGGELHQWPNRSLLSKASQEHLSELNTYELCTGWYKITAL